eukprot:COSAG02_NODE_7_length_64539_cov_120.393482_63_plen_191_part_00
MSTLDNISSVDMLESLITKDPRWTWILQEWEDSSDEKLLTLSETVHRFREMFIVSEYHRGVQDSSCERFKVRYLATPDQRQLRATRYNCAHMHCDVDLRSRRMWAASYLLTRLVMNENSQCLESFCTGHARVRVERGGYGGDGAVAGNRRSARSAVAKQTNAMTFYIHTWCHAAQENARRVRSLCCVLSC